MTKDRFALVPCPEEEGYWVATDHQNGVSVRFREHAFGSSRQVTLMSADAIRDAAQDRKKPIHTRALYEWVSTTHYDIAYPSALEQRQQICRALCAIRERQNYTQKSVAALSGIAPSCISQAESGLLSVGIDVVNKMTNVLGVRLEIVEE